MQTSNVLCCYYSTITKAILKVAPNAETCHGKIVLVDRANTHLLCLTATPILKEDLDNKCQDSFKFFHLSFIYRATIKWQWHLMEGVWHIMECVHRDIWWNVSMNHTTWHVHLTFNGGFSIMCSTSFPSKNSHPCILHELSRVCYPWGVYVPIRDVLIRLFTQVVRACLDSR